MFASGPYPWRRIRKLTTAALCLPLIGAASHSWAACDDYDLSRAELTSILDGTLGGIRPFVRERDATVDLARPACYLQMSLVVGVEIGPLKQSCRATACSVGLASGTRIGIRRFSIAGCDVVFQATGRSREIDTVYTDIAERIRAHCGSDGYRISRIVPGTVAGEGVVRLSFEPAKK